MLYTTNNMAKNGPASSLYAPGEVPRGSQARPRWPLAADSPPVRPVWTWVARGLIGGAAPQAPAVDGGDGGTRRLAAPHRAHIGVLSRRDRPASRWSGPAPVRRAPSEKLARRLASAPPDQSAARDDQVLDIGAS